MAQTMHASCVKMMGQGVLIRGASGRGKSTLALALIAQGAKLVADDQVCLHHAAPAGVIASRPATLPCAIEARGIGLLAAPMARIARVAWVIDMDRDEDERLPPLRHFTILGQDLPLLYRGPRLSFAQSIAHLLRFGRITT